MTTSFPDPKGLSAYKKASKDNIAKAKKKRTKKADAPRPTQMTDKPAAKKPAKKAPAKKASK